MLARRREFWEWGASVLELFLLFFFFNRATDFAEKERLLVLYRNHDLRLRTFQSLI